MPTFVDADAWYATLATLYGSAAALITSPAGEVLLVKPNYRELWSLPGGILEEGGRRNNRRVRHGFGPHLYLDRSTHFVDPLRSCEFDARGRRCSRLVE